MPRQLAQKQMTLSDLEWPFHASRTISAVTQDNMYQILLQSVRFCRLYINKHFGVFSIRSIDDFVEIY